MEQLDLNLLRLMLVLLEEGSVTAAAQRLHLSQSAVSKQLSRLRQQLGASLEDPLFVRSGQGLVPTAKARAMEAPLRQWLRQSCDLVTPERFDPRRDERQFRCSIAEATFPVIIPQFLPVLSAQAPGLQLNLLPQTPDALLQMERGQLDLLIIGRDTDPRARPPWHVSHLPDLPYLELYDDNHVCLLRQDHPALDAPWNLDAFLSIGQIKIWVEGSELWLMDHVLAAQGLQREGNARVPDFHSAALLAQHSDMGFVCATAFADQLAQRYNLASLPLPLDLAPISFRMLWPKALDRDPAHRWLRALIAQRCRGLGLTSTSVR